MQKYKLGQIVYLITDTEQSERMVIAILIEQGSVTYKLANGAAHYWATEIEISTDRDNLKSLING